jgi:TIR domain/Bacterial Ig-like domain (group 2)
MNTCPKCHKTYQQDVEVCQQDGTRLLQSGIDSQRPVIFVSYANEDRETARAVARLLESAGYTVWWDRRIPAGRTWRSMIEQALSEMHGMVVLWSNHSVESDWVKEEAEEARALGRLIPVLIEPVKPPVGFRSIQAAELTDWDGTNDCLGARQLIADLQSLVGKQTAQELPTNVGIPKLSYPKTPMTLLASAIFLMTLVIVVWGIVNRWKFPFASEPVQIMALLIQAPKTKINVGQTVPLKVNARYSDGREVDVGREVEWASSNRSILTISPAGQAQAQSVGEVDVNARIGELMSPPVRLSIVGLSDVQPKPQPHVISLMLESDKQRLFVNDRARLRVKALFSDGAIREITEGVDWQSTDNSVINISTNGQLEAVKEGKARVTGRFRGAEAETLLIEVQARRAQTQKSPNVRPQTQDKAQSRPMVSNHGLEPPNRWEQEVYAQKSFDTQAEKTTIVPQHKPRDVISEYIQGEKQRRGR